MSEKYQQYVQYQYVEHYYWNPFRGTGTVRGTGTGIGLLIFFTLQIYF